MKKLSYVEKRQIEYLRNRKEKLIDKFIGACEEINAQIKDIKERSSHDE